MPTNIDNSLKNDNSLTELFFSNVINIINIEKWSTISMTQVLLNQYVISIRP